MVVLLVVMAIMAVGALALLPTWRQQAIREQEEELIFRGNQYARAVLLYSRKNNNLLPSDVDALYTGRFLRKKYKDPITGEDFGLLPAGQPAGAAGRGSLGTGRGAATTQPSGRGGTQIIGSFQGVYSKSTATSIRIYQNQQRYIDWPFTFQMAQLQMGQARGVGPNPGRGTPPGGGRNPGAGRNPGLQPTPPGGRPGGGAPAAPVRPGGGGGQS